MSPYEVVRLARHAGLSTTEFLERYTQGGGAFLAHAAHSTACALLDGSLCTVHPDRPLACRLYPLCRIEIDGIELFVELEPQPETEGLYGTDDTVEAYLDEQGVVPFLKAHSLYTELHAEIEQTLQRDDPDGYAVTPGAGNLLDVDAVTRPYCERHNIAVPGDNPWALIKLHLAAVREVLTIGDDC